MTQTEKLLSGVLVLSGCLLGGCESQPPSPQELGRIVYREADVPGADKPYALPEYLRKAPPAPEPEGRKPGD
ncbi:MAG: hypothetical protein ACREHD_26575 [Pirellulales bacterium]